MTRPLTFPSQITSVPFLVANLLNRLSDKMVIELRTITYLIIVSLFMLCDLEKFVLSLLSIQLIIRLEIKPRMAV